MSDRDRQVKDEAYRIWDAAGRPEGRDDEHWFEAEKRIAAGEREPTRKAKKAKAATPVVKNAGNSGVAPPVSVVEPKTTPSEPRLKKGDVVDIAPAKGEKPKGDKKTDMKAAKKPEKPAKPKSKA